MKELKLKIKKLESRETKTGGRGCTNSGNVCSMACYMEGSPLCVD